MTHPYQIPESLNIETVSGCTWLHGDSGNFIFIPRMDLGFKKIALLIVKLARSHYFTFKRAATTSDAN